MQQEYNFYLKLSVEAKGSKSQTEVLCEIQQKLRECKLSNVQLQAVEDEEDQQ